VKTKRYINVIDFELTWFDATEKSELGLESWYCNLIPVHHPLLFLTYLKIAYRKYSIMLSSSS